MICAICLIINGCASFGFKTERKSRFVDADANTVYVEYGKEERTETLPNGAELKFDRKVRVTFQNGKRITLYQTLAPSGVRYQSADKKFIFVERGPYCQILENGFTIYQGLFNKDCTEKKKK
ncbi:MAG: hypothetical protein WC340_00530 [Kiritimatiellia bacterium]